MPKIIDHEQYRTELARKAVTVFRSHGYHGLGMRKVAQELGISKSALYHYFSSKEALFAECTKQMISREKDTIDTLSLATMSHDDRIEALFEIFWEIEKDFKGEMTLLFDYIRPLTPTQVSDDKNMQLANDHYLELVTALVGPKDAQFVLCLMFGALLQRLLDGQQCDLTALKEQLTAITRPEKDPTE